MFQRAHNQEPMEHVHGCLRAKRRAIVRARRTSYHLVCSITMKDSYGAQRSMKHKYFGLILLSFTFLPRSYLLLSCFRFSLSLSLSLSFLLVFVFVSLFTSSSCYVSRNVTTVILCAYSCKSFTLPMVRSTKITRSPL